MESVANKIINRVSDQPIGWVCTPKDFLDLGSRQAVDQALSRLVKAGQLRRISRGLYDKPRFSKILNRLAPVYIHFAIDAVVRRDGLRTLPEGYLAAYNLRLTTGVPAKISIVTDGRSRTLKIGEQTVRFRHAGPSVMQWAGRPSAPVVQALRWFGPRFAEDPEIISSLKSLPDHMKRDLLENSRDLPGWAQPLVRSIKDEKAVSV